MVVELVVATWNLQGRDPARVELPEAIHEWQPDVLLLQEAAGDRIREVLPDGYPTCLWWPEAGYPPGLAIVSRLAVLGSGVVAAGVTSTGRPRLGWGRLRLGRGELTVASVHLLAPPWPGTPARRREQRRGVAAWAAGELASARPLVVGGDFNTIDPAIDGLTDLAAGDPRPTWRPLAVPWMRPIFRIDAIFGGGSVIAVAAARPDDRWRRSDHIPVVARVTA